MAQFGKTLSAPTLDVRGTVESLAAIRIVVLKVGVIPKAVFNTYYSILASTKEIMLQDVSPWGDSDSFPNPFPFRKWMKSSVLVEIITEEFAHSKWEDFQAHRKVSGVIGLLYGSKGLQLGELPSKFYRHRQAILPSALVTRLFLVDADLESITINPADNMDVIPDHGEDKIKSYVTALLQDTVSQILFEFQKKVNDSSNITFLGTHLDTSVADESKSKKQERRKARILKHNADYCLMAADCSSAQRYFQESYEICTSINDHLWAAGCLEGESASLLVLVQQNHGAEIPDGVLEAVIQKYEMAIELYTKVHTVELQLEGMLKLSQVSILQQDHATALELFTSIWSSATPIPTLDKINLARQMAKLCAAMQFNRKAGFYMYQAGILEYSKRVNSHSALKVYLHAAPFYHIPIKLDPKLGVLTKTEAIPTQKPAGWAALQENVLREIARMARWENPPVPWYPQILFFILTHYKDCLDIARQRELVSDLYKTAPSFPKSAGNPSIAPMSWIVRMKALPLPTSLNPIRTRARSAIDGLFLHNPFKDKEFQKKGPIQWVSGEECEVEVTICNPFKIDLHISCIFLSATKLPIEAHKFRPKTPIIIKPRQDHTFTLTCTPTAPGFCTLRGVWIVWPHVPFIRPLFLDISPQAPDFQSIIKVLPSLPKLEVALLQPDPCALLHGQTKSMELNLTNRSPRLAIDFLTIEMSVDSNDAILCSTEDISGHLPMNAGSQITLPITIQSVLPLLSSKPKAAASGYTLTITLNYGRNGEEYHVPLGPMWEEDLKNSTSLDNDEGPIRTDFNLSSKPAEIQALDEGYPITQPQRQHQFSLDVSVQEACNVVQASLSDSHESFDVVVQNHCAQTVKFWMEHKKALGGAGTKQESAVSIANHAPCNGTPSSECKHEMLTKPTNAASDDHCKLCVPLSPFIELYNTSLSPQDFMCKVLNRLELHYLGPDGLEASIPLLTKLWELPPSKPLLGKKGRPLPPPKKEAEPKGPFVLHWGSLECTMEAALHVYPAADRPHSGVESESSSRTNSISSDSVASDTNPNPSRLPYVCSLFEEYLLQFHMTSYQASQDATGSVEIATAEVDCPLSCSVKVLQYKPDGSYVNEDEIERSLCIAGLTSLNLDPEKFGAPLMHEVTAIFYVPGLYKLELKFADVHQQKSTHMFNIFVGGGHNPN